MFVLRISTHVAGPPGCVFDYVSDFRHAPDWQEQLSGIRLPDGPFPKGTHVVEIRRMLGRTFDAHGELVAWDPPRGLTVRGSSGPLHVESRYTFEQVEGGGTRVEIALTVRGTGPIRAAAPLLRRVFRHQAEADMRRLTAVLDGRARAPQVVLSRVH
jgi:hypothetical protein